MLRLLSLLVIVLLSVFAEAQEPQLVPYRKKNLWGYSDIDGKIVITPKYSRVSFFSGPYARVFKSRPGSEDPFNGVIDPKGKEIIPAVYASLQQVPYLDDWKKFVLDNKKSLHTDIYYGTASKRQAIFDSLYKVGVIRYTYILRNTAGKEALYALNGKPITPFIYDRISFFMFADTGFILRVEKNGKMGLMNDKGKMVKPMVYTNIVVNNAYSPYGKEDGNIFYTKEPIRKPKNTEEAAPMLQELATVETGMGMGIIEEPRSGVKPRRSGKVGMTGPYDIIIPSEYDTLYMAEAYSNRTNVIVSNNDKWGVVGQRNNVLIPLKYSAVKFFRTDRKAEIRGVQQFFVKDSLNNWGIVNERNIELLPLVYEIISPIEYTSGPYPYLEVLKVKKNGVWGLIKDENKPLLTPAYEQIGIPAFSNKQQTTFYVSVVKDGKWGVINEKNEFVVPTQFDEQPYIDYPIHKGYIIIKKLDQKGLYILNAPEKSIIPQFEFDTWPAISFQSASGKIVDIFRVKDKAGLEYYIGTNGVIFYQ